MATMEQVKSLTYDAGTDLSSDQHKFVIQAADDGNVDLCGNEGEQASGVLLNAPDVTEAATVAYTGVVKVIAAETLAPADKITTNNAGLAIVADNVNTDHVLGMCLNDALINELAEVQLDNAGILAA